MTATIETNLRQGEFEIGLGFLERQKSSARTQKQIIVEEVISTVHGEVFVAVRQHGWTCPQPHGNAVVFILDGLMSADTEIPKERERHRPSCDRFVCVGKNDVTV